MDFPQKRLLQPSQTLPNTHFLHKKLDFHQKSCKFKTHSGGKWGIMEREIRMV